MIKTCRMKKPPCQICEEESSGFHYGANTCEACKGFFKRCLKKKTSFTCISSTVAGKCDINIWKRACCSYCRLQKCLEIGMGRDSIKTGRHTYEKKTKDTLEIKRLEKASGIFKASATFTETELEEVIETISANLKKHLPWTHEAVVMKSEKEKEFLEKQRLQEAMFGSLKPVSREEYMQVYCQTGLDVDGREEVMLESSKWFETFISDFTSFAKSIPGFNSLPLHDRILLVKDAMSEVWYYWNYDSINIELGIHTTPWGVAVPLDLYPAMGHHSEVYDFARKCVQNLQRLCLTYEEKAILGCVALMACDDLDIDKKDIVESSQLLLVEAFQLLLSRSHPENFHIILAKTLGILTEFRSIKSLHREEDVKVTLEWGDKVHFPDIVYELLS